MVPLRALGHFWGELSDDGLYLELRRADARVARIDLVATAKTGRVVFARLNGKTDASETVVRSRSTNVD